MANSDDNLWGPIDIAKWNEIPHVSGRLATEQDVKEGRAAFYIAGDRDALQPIDIPLPACAILYDEASKEATPVVLIQAEETPAAKVVGYRYLFGGNGICTLAELEILKGPDLRFG